MLKSKQNQPYFSDRKQKKPANYNLAFSVEKLLNIYAELSLDQTDHKISTATQSDLIIQIKL